MSDFIIDLHNQRVTKTEEIELSQTEIKIISILGSTTFVDIKDIARFLNSDTEDTCNIRMHIHRLKQKGFNIEAKSGAYGMYRLNEEVYFK